MARQKDGKKLAKSMVFLGVVEKEVSMMSMVVAKEIPRSYDPKVQVVTC